MTACEAFKSSWRPLRRDESEPCGNTATTVIRVACVHEHVSDRSVCDECADPDLCRDFCGTCFDFDGHICDVTITPIAAVTS